ncbi:hypothetical protein MASR2M32_04710 [Sphaerotilus sulfidivorans]
MIKVDVAIKNFNTAFNSAINLLSAVYPYVDYSCDGFSVNPLHPNQAHQIVGLSFLKIVAAWEDFLEESFVRYLCGAKTSNGYAPKLNITGCKNIQTAYNLLNGSSDFKIGRDYLSWSNLKHLENRAALFFVDGKPYSELMDYNKNLIREATLIRNRVAHSSEKCVQDFNRLVKAKKSIAKLPPGFTVGRFLMEPTPKKPRRIEEYCDAFVESTEQIIK